MILRNAGLLWRYKIIYFRIPSDQKKSFQRNHEENKLWGIKPSPSCPDVFCNMSREITPNFPEQLGTHWPSLSEKVSMSVGFQSIGPFILCLASFTNILP